MSHNGTFVILDLLLSLLSPIYLSSPLFFSLINNIISFSFSKLYINFLNISYFPTYFLDCGHNGICFLGYNRAIEEV